MNASMASGVVDVCLIPEIKFKEEKLLAFVDRWVLLSLLLLASRGLGGRGAAQLPAPAHPTRTGSPRSSPSTPPSTSHPSHARVRWRQHPEEEGSLRRVRGRGRRTGHPRRVHCHRPVGQSRVGGHRDAPEGLVQERVQGQGRQVHRPKLHDSVHTYDND